MHTTAVKGFLLDPNTLKQKGVFFFNYLYSIVTTREKNSEKNQHYVLYILYVKKTYSFVYGIVEKDMATGLWIGQTLPVHGVHNAGPVPLARQAYLGWRPQNFTFTQNFAKNRCYAFKKLHYVESQTFE
jgi:hypothetical protein